MIDIKAMKIFRCASRSSIGRPSLIKGDTTKATISQRSRDVAGMMVTVIECIYQILAAMALCIKVSLLRCFMRSMKYSLPSSLSSTGSTTSFWQQTKIKLPPGLHPFARMSAWLIIIIVIIDVVSFSAYSSFFLLSD